MDSPTYAPPLFAKLLARSADGARRAAPPGDVPGWFVGGLLLVGVFSPYGLFEAGGGALRPDHIAMYLAFFGLAIAGRTRVSEPLAATLLAFAAWASIATIPWARAFVSAPVASLKNFDQILRGPFILVIASSLRPTAKDVRAFLVALVLTAVTLATMATIERVLPPNAPIVREFVVRYGGIIYDTGVYAAMRVNHKELMNLVGRASATFVTPPALSFAAIFFLIVSAERGTGLSTFARVVLAAAGLVSGVASNSKSFVLGLPILLFMQAQRLERRRAGWVVIAVVLAAVVVGVASSLDLNTNPLSHVADADDKLEALTAGRYGQSGSLLAIALEVLEISPIAGFGIVNPVGRTFGLGTGDIALNKFIIFGGGIGVMIAAIGILTQIGVFRSAPKANPWRTIGLRTMIMSLAFSVGAAIFHMPRVVDIMMTLIGVSAAMVRYPPHDAVPAEEL